MTEVALCRTYKGSFAQKFKLEEEELQEKNQGHLLHRLLQHMFLDPSIAKKKKKKV